MSRSSRGFRVRFAAFLLAVLGAPLAQGCSQQPSPAPLLQQRGAAAAPQVEAERPLSDYQQENMAAWAKDFADLQHFQAANAALPPMSAGERRVVFFGDSITDFWKLDKYFPGKSYINRGISGQTTSQMLLRFRQDVLELKPRMVVILAGTNDIAGNTGHISIENIEGNLTSMAELARAHNIALVLASVTPVNNYTAASRDFFADRPPAEILRLNEWMRAYCDATNCYYLDYFSAMVDRSGLMKRELTEDGLHPNDAGYKVMAPLAETAIEKTMAR